MLTYHQINLPDNSERMCLALVACSQLFMNGYGYMIHPKDSICKVHVDLFSIFALEFPIIVVLQEKFKLM